MVDPRFHRQQHVSLFYQGPCSGAMYLTFRSACENPGSDLARRTLGEIKKRGFVCLKERNSNDLFNLK